MRRHLALAGILATRVALAHVGNVPAKATFVDPAPPPSSFTDAGDGTVVYGKWTPAEADKVYHFDWIDGDVDPTGKFTFYYVDHDLSDGVSRDQLDQVGVKVVDTMGRTAESVFVSCDCSYPDGGVVQYVCADLAMMTRWCDNAVDWDTSKIPDGVYWLAAANDDPPFHVYNLSLAPVIVHHTAARPPAVIVLKPDGVGDADRSAHVGWLASSTGAWKVNLSWGDNDVAKVLGPTNLIVKDLAPGATDGSGLFFYDWDTSSLPNGLNFFVRAQITDAAGTSYSDSRNGMGVFHGALRDGAGPLDFAMGSDGGISFKPPMGCGCAVGAASPTENGIGIAIAMAIALTILRGLRRGSRSACRSSRRSA